MKLIKNIYGIFCVINATASLGKQKKSIDHARTSGDLELEKVEILKACNVWSTNIIKKFKLNIEVVGKENLPEKGPVVYIANHQSYCDVLAFLYVIRSHQVAFIAKDSLKKIPILGAWIARIRGIFIHRGDARSSLQSINQGVDIIRQGFSVAIFPEGTRSQGPVMDSFKAGSFKLATKAKVPIVPISLEGGYHTYEENHVVAKGCTMKFMVHPAIDTTSLSREELAMLPEQVEQIIRSGVLELQQ